MSNLEQARAAILGAQYEFKRFPVEFRGQQLEAIEPNVELFNAIINGQKGPGGEDIPLGILAIINCIAIAGTDQRVFGKADAAVLQTSIPHRELSLLMKPAMRAMGLDPDSRETAIEIAEKNSEATQANS